MHSKLVRVLFCVLLSASLIGCGSTDTAAGSVAESETAVVTAKTNEELVKQYSATNIELDDTQILVDGSAVSEDSASAVYAAKDIVFYLEGQDFTYGEGTEEDEHSQEEADAHTVVHITQPGNYVVSGSLLKGQIAVDLGEDAKDDENAVVTLILNNADITCEVAPAVIFYEVYECGSDDEEDASNTVDTSKAGANVILADGSVNNISGSHVARIYESVELNEAGTEVVDSKKLHKYDAAFYSKKSMNVNGEDAGDGVLNITADNEGLDTELHLTINGGNINITSGNDGINTNEDGISVTTINGGSVNIVVTGDTGEGDGIDSNGWLVINGGNVTAAACSFSQDAGIDSDMGIHLNGGTVMATGNMLDEIADSAQNYVVFTFDGTQKAGSSYTLKNADGTVIGEWTPANDFSMLVFCSAELETGTYTLWMDGEQLSVQASMNGMRGGKGGMMGGQRPEKSADEKMPEMPDGEKPQGGGRNGQQMPDGENLEMPDGEIKQNAQRNDKQRPEMSTDGEMPELPDGEMPEMPTDGELPTEGEAREMPNGKNAGNGETSMEFEIVDGGNMFRVVSVE